MSGRRIVLLALIGLVPIAIALWVAGFDIYQQIGRYVLAQGVVLGEEAVVPSPVDGQVVEVRAQTGQRVQAGEQLFSLSTAGSDIPTNVTAPDDAMVQQVGVAVGEAVRSGDRLAVLDVSSRLHVLAYVDERSVSAVQPGQKADVTIPALGATYVGLVRQVLSAAAVNTAVSTPAAGGASGGVRYPVWIDFDYGGAPVRAAMTASARIYR